MAARAIGTSTVSFGLVTIPVKLFATGESGARVSFNWIDKNSGTRVRQQYFNPDTGAVVPREDMVKGYEFAKNQYVLFEPDELKALEQPKTDAIEITEFVPAELVDRVFFDKAYYLGPDKGGGRAYRLLSAALGETDRVAIAKFATRGKQYLVMIRPYKDGLLLDQLRYANEVKAWDEVPVEDDDINEAELKPRRAIDRAGSDRRVQPGGLQGRSPRKADRAHPTEDRGRGDLGRACRRAPGSDHRLDGGAQGQHHGRRRGRIRTQAREPGGQEGRRQEDGQEENDQEGRLRLT